MSLPREQHFSDEELFEGSQELKLELVRHTDGRVSGTFEMFGVATGEMARRMVDAFTWHAIAAAERRDDYDGDCLAEECDDE